MFSVNGSTSKTAWLVYNPSLTTLVKQFSVKTTFMHLTHQLIQGNERPSPLLPQAVDSFALNFKTTNYYYSYYLLFSSLTHSGLPFKGGRGAGL